MLRISARIATVLFSTSLVVVGFSFHPSFAQAPAAGVVALTGARLIDGTGRAPFDRATLVIRNGRIDPSKLNVVLQKIDTH